MTTLKDISKKLNLSVTTVSRALNGYPEVNAQTRERVLQTANDMNYRPNQFARNLVQGKSGMVGLIVKSSVTLSADSHFLEIITGLSEHFSQKDLHFILHVSTEADEMYAYQQMVQRGALDGFILISPYIHDPRIQFLQEKGIPFVVHGRAQGEVNYAFYDIDNYQVAYIATQHLAQLGHQRIALLNGDQAFAFSQQRTKGYQAALTAHQLLIHHPLIHYHSMTEQYGYNTAKALLSLTQKPSAFVCANTLVARGVIAAARSLGVRIPDDISLVVHDDALPQLRTAHPQPALTATRSPLRDACAPLADLLVRRIQGEKPEKLQYVADLEWIECHSSQPYPKKSNSPKVATS